MNTDISRCDNNDCPRRKTCKRYVDKADKPYWVTLFDHRNCKHYIKK